MARSAPLRRLDCRRAAALHGVAQRVDAASGGVSAPRAGVGAVRPPQSPRRRPALQWAPSCRALEIFALLRGPTVFAIGARSESCTDTDPTGCDSEYEHTAQP